MPTIIPLHGAGDGLDEPVEVEVIYSAFGGLRVVATSDNLPAAFGAIELTGERLDTSKASADVKGHVLRSARGSVDNGAVPEATGYGAADVGNLAPIDPGFGSMETEGESIRPAISTVQVMPGAGVIGRAFASLAAKYQSIQSSLGSYRSRSRPTFSASVAVIIRGLWTEPSRSTLETGQETGLPVLSSVDIGIDQDTEALGSVEALTGEGVDFIIDIQDEILASGHGDC